MNKAEKRVGIGGTILALCAITAGGVITHFQDESNTEFRYWQEQTGVATMSDDVLRDWQKSLSLEDNKVAKMIERLLQIRERKHVRQEIRDAAGKTLAEEE